MRQPDFGSQTASPPFVGCTVQTQGGAGAILRYGPFPYSDRWPEMQEGSREPAISRA
jgi:hypothetical protein